MKIIARQYAIAAFAICTMHISLAAPPDAPLAEVIAEAGPKVVKIYGGRVGTVAAYGAGVVVSADGRIVTALTSMLEDTQLRIVAHDGKRYPAKVVARDERRQLAELKIEASDLPHFGGRSSTHVAPGDWVIAAANPFKVAEGSEPVSFAVGTLSARAPLAARRRTQDIAFDGTVLLTDVIVTTPGSAGGALLDARGELIGIIGKAVVSSRTNTWLNYALPVEEVAAFLDRTDEPQPAVSRNSAASQPTDAGEFTSNFPQLGLFLFNVGGRTRPAFVERVRIGSPAYDAGVRAGDLILSYGGEQTATCDEFRAAVAKLAVARSATVSVKRGDEIKSLELLLPVGP